MISNVLHYTYSTNVLSRETWAIDRGWGSADEYEAHSQLES